MVILNLIFALIAIWAFSDLIKNVDGYIDAFGKTPYLCVLLIQCFCVTVNSTFVFQYIQKL